MVLDHYLEVLRRRPDAHQRYWDAVRRTHVGAAGTRALIEVRFAHRTLPPQPLTAAMTATVSSGIVDSLVIAIEARRHASGPARR